MRIKLYISPCPNDTFMFDALINGRIDTLGMTFDVEYYDIEELNRRSMLGEADVSKISCAVLPHIKQHYTLCDSGAALGHGNGPLLVRRKGTSEHINKIAVPGVHTTANALIGRLFPEIKERTPILFSQIAQRVNSGEFDAGVLIHEGRFTYHEHDLSLIADLGLLWEERTRLPLPLGGIVMHNNMTSQHKKLFTSLLRQSIEYAFQNPLASREFIKEHAQEMDDEVISSHIKLFVNEYSLSLGDEGYVAIKELIG